MGLMPDEPEVLGLLGLMLLIESRRAARTTAAGELVALGEQDRSTWDPWADRRRPGAGAPLSTARPAGPYQIQAAINAVHSDASSALDTDWRQILVLYDQLLSVSPGPVVALNRAVALAEVEGPASRFRWSTIWVSNTTTCTTRSAPTCCAAWVAARRRQRPDEAAIARTENAAEKAYLQRRRAELSR